MAGQIRDDQAASPKKRLHLREIPGRTTKAVDEQERRPLAPGEDADPGAAPFVEPLFQARQQIEATSDSLRHADRLWCGHCELDGDKAGRVKLPVLRRKELESSPASALCAAGFFVA